jgi:hypothetical protein
VAALCATVTIVVAACSSGDDDAADGDAAAGGSATRASGQPVTGAPIDTPEAPTGEGVASAPAASLTHPSSTPPATPAPQSTGVPGLDSGDSFCAAWSRFGGSWQVLVQAGAMAEAAEVARLEVIASTLVGDAYDDVFAAWPAELERERDVVADAYFGAFQRRSADAAQSLADAGASSDDIATLADAWATALEAFDPLAPSIGVAVPEDLEQTVDAAAIAFAEQRVPLPADPSMVITASTPLTDEFLASACPDEGWIVGQDVGA